MTKPGDTDQPYEREKELKTRKSLNKYMNDINLFRYESLSCGTDGIMSEILATKVLIPIDVYLSRMRNLP